MRTSRSLIAVAAGVAVLVLGACGGGGGGTSKPKASATTTSTTQDPVAAKAEIKATWETFFAEGTTTDRAVAILQNGEKHRAFIQSEVDKGLKKGTSAAVHDIMLEDPPVTAVVTYDIVVNGTPALRGSTGRAVYVNGHWLVSEETNCSLEALGNGNTPPPDCVGVGG